MSWPRSAQPTTPSTHRTKPPLLRRGVPEGRSSWMPAESAPAFRSLSKGSGGPKVATGASVSKLTAVLALVAVTAADSVDVEGSRLAVCRLAGPNVRAGEGEEPPPDAGAAGWRWLAPPAPRPGPGSPRRAAAG